MRISSIAGHGSVEAHFTGRMAAGAEAEAFEHGAVGEDEDGGRSLGFHPTWPRLAVSDQVVSGASRA